MEYFLASVEEFDTDSFECNIVDDLAGTCIGTFHLREGTFDASLDPACFPDISAHDVTALEYRVRDAGQARLQLLSDMAKQAHFGDVPTHALSDAALHSIRYASHFYDPSTDDVHIPFEV